MFLVLIYLKMTIYIILSIFICIFIFEGAESREKGVINCKRVVNYVNNQNATWRAYDYGINKLKKSYMKKFLGAKLSNSRKLKVQKPDDDSDSDSGSGSDENEQNDDSSSDLPINYDARDRYPNCESIGHIYDQANCGSCWAVSSAAALSDRFCIKSNGTMKVKLSSNHLLSCQKRNYGCEGGYMETAWEFMKETGLVSGADFDSFDGCQPYSIRPCGFFDTFPCAYRSALTPKCIKTRCTNDWYKYRNETNTYKVSDWFAVEKTRNRSIEREIYENGPISAGFIVYIDFLFYTNGIYSPFWRFPIGGHAVKVIGWGVENGTKYWLAVNSWSKRWGEDGLFRIKRGINAAGFEEGMHGGLPILNKH